MFSGPYLNVRIEFPFAIAKCNYLYVAQVVLENFLDRLLNQRMSDSWTDFSDCFVA